MFSKTLFVFCIVCFLSDLSHGQSDTLRNDYTYIEAAKSFYKIHTIPQTWFDAKRNCAQDEDSLFYPENDDEAHAVMSFRNGTQPDIEWMFVGMSDLLSEGVFETIDGKSVSEVYNTWMSDEPNDDLGTQDCVQQNQKGELNDHKCSDKFSYICKKTLLSLTRNYSNNYIVEEPREEPTDRVLSRDNYTYIKALKSLYKIHLKPQTWQIANQECAKEGASLFYPENEEEQNTVFSFRNKISIYLGISDIKSEGVFKTIDGKLLSEVYSNWRSGEPNDDQNNGGEDCVIQGSAGKMNDISCINKMFYICKKKLPPLKRMYSCNIDYSFNKDSGNCYKLHTTPLKWTGAYVSCLAEQAHLAVINNRLVADYLAKLTESASKHRFGGYQQLSRGVYHLGFNYTFKEGWRTVKGTPMKVDDDAWWDNHQPIVDEREQCGSMFYTGRLNSINCDTKSFFICEHKAKNSIVSEDVFQ